MKLSQARVQHLAQTIWARLHSQGYLKITGADRTAIQALEKALTDELSVEDRVNAEVRELLRTYQAEIEQGRVDYQKMFTMIKSKLVRERGLIL